MREYDVTPQQQGSECIYQGECNYYKFGIWCNNCNQYTEEYDIIDDDE